MNDNATSIGKLIERAEDFSKSTFELLKIQAIDKSADVVSTLVLRIVIFMAVALSILIINIGIALWIGKLLGNVFFGFFAIGGLYALIAVLLHYFGQQWIKIPVSNSIIIKMLQLKSA